MDIELLSSLVRKLILESDEVAVPGLGTFATSLVVASFSDRGYTINPPYRKLDFIPSEAPSSDGTPAAQTVQAAADGNLAAGWESAADGELAAGGESAADGNFAADGELAVEQTAGEPKGGEVPAIIGRIAATRKIALAQAAAELAECVQAIRAELEAERLAQLPGLGKLRLTKEGEIFFVAAEDLNIYPEGFGLEPVSLKNKEAQAADVASAEVAPAVGAPAEVESAKVVAPAEVAPAEVTPAASTLAENAPKTANLAQNVGETGESASKSADLARNGGETGESASKTVNSAQNVGETGESASKSPDLARNEAEVDATAGPTPETATPTAAVVAAPATNFAGPTPKARKRLPAAVRVILILVAVLLIAAVALRVLGTLAPDFVDRLLYSPEELEILRQSL